MRPDRSNRREFITLVGRAAAGWPLGAHAQQPIETKLVAFLHSGSAQPNILIASAFRRGLAETGFAEPKNLMIEERWAEDHYDRLPEFTADLIRRPVAAIAANSIAALAAKAVTTTIPIVFQSGVDPVAIGLVASLGHPGGNATGVSYFASTLEAKKLEMLHEILPQTAAVALLVNARSPKAEDQSREIQVAGRILGRPILIFRVGDQIDFETAFAGIAQQEVRGLVVVGDPFLNSRRKELISLAARHAIPAIYSNRENVDDGGLISYGSSLTEAYRQVGIYTGRILKGEKASNLPVLQPTKFELIINLKTAKALGLSLSPDLLDRADELIE
jgi:putative ABC transport system substrate-binding protein